MKMIVHRHLLCLNLFRFVKLVNLYVTKLLQSSFQKNFFLVRITRLLKYSTSWSRSKTENHWVVQYVYALRLYHKIKRSSPQNITPSLRFHHKSIGLLLQNPSLDASAAIRGFSTNVTLLIYLANAKLFKIWTRKWYSGTISTFQTQTSGLKYKLCILYYC